ncbi:MAG: uvsE [Anaerosporomusa subterranea]|jgi:UV DNA damage endonuclease|nr:uvsE [Anaerosporomusa subterranea]
MLIRFGYVAIAFGIQEGSPNKTVTVKKLSKLENAEVKLELLRKILRQNLDTTRRILLYNQAHNIHLYRLTSKLVPLATHPEAEGWDYSSEFRQEFADLGRLARESNCRLSAHPDHFTLLNSPKSEVLAASLRELEYHDSIFRALGYPPGPQLVLHAGGMYKNKKQSLDRFCREFAALPDTIRQRIMIENDDKVYTAADVLSLCKKLGAPLVLDVHHHNCLNNGEALSELWPDIVSTWGDARPKIHISSPKSEKDRRSHAELINVKSLLPFLSAASKLDRDFDVMIEAKGKDRALFTLLDELERTPGIRRVEEAAIII